MTDLSMPSSSVRFGAAVPVPAPDVDENATGDVAVAKTPTKKTVASQAAHLHAVHDGRHGNAHEPV